MDDSPRTTRPARRHWLALGGTTAAVTALMIAAATSRAAPASAAEAPVGLGTTASYSVLGGQAVTNTGPSTLAADLGVSPGTAITGFPPGTTAGATHAGDAAALQAQSDLVVAYDDAASRAPTMSIAGDLVGRTLTTGVYNSSGPIALSGTLTLDAQGDPNATFLFQVASTLITASASSVSLLNGAQACNVFWQVGSSATLGTNSVFTGTILALTSISVTTGTTVQGRALARNGQVSLDNNVFTAPGCDLAPPTTTTTSTTSTTTTSGGGTTTTSGGPGGSTTGTTATTGTTLTIDGQGGDNSGGGNGAGGNGGGNGNGGAGSGGTTSGKGKLADTGVSALGPVIGLGGLLLGAGGLLLAVARNRSGRRAR